MDTDKKYNRTRNQLLSKQKQSSHHFSSIDNLLVTYDELQSRATMLPNCIYSVSGTKSGHLISRGIPFITKMFILYNQGTSLVQVSPLSPKCLFYIIRAPH